MMTSADLRAEKGESIEEFGDVSSIDISDGFTTIVSHTTTTGKTFYITDAKVSATQNGTFRMKLNGYVVCVQYYGSGNIVDCARTTPFVIPSTATILIEFKTDVDGASAAANFGGYEI